MEVVNDFIKKTIIHAYEESCPLKQRRSTGDPLVESRALLLEEETRRLFNQAKMTGRWEKYKIHCREYVYAIRKAKEKILEETLRGKQENLGRRKTPEDVAEAQPGRERKTEVTHHVQQNGTIWYTDGSKTEQCTGAGATNRDPGCEISINLGNYATVFQAEITAISACAQEMTRRSYTNKRIQIISDSQAALKALGAVEIHSQVFTYALDPEKKMEMGKRSRKREILCHYGIGKSKY
ncbi:hypothetical protein NQ318_014596 [Aromia moschata]|uniref:RNase H type-1 domain-containing protein n=1 Tax=Aromia moschata TaxID=1265417 RepID=A0AAV8ZCN9_9CUCU|nr:hypothetical protein NQ318_014596 [Aromia moschata]